MTNTFALYAYMENLYCVCYETSVNRVTPCYKHSNYSAFVRGLHAVYDNRIIWGNSLPVLQWLYKYEVK